MASREISFDEHNQTLYAKNRAIPDDSMTLVRRIAKPINVRKMRAVMAAPRNEADNGVVATLGYATTIHQAAVT